MKNLLQLMILFLISNKLKFNKEPLYVESRPNEVYEAMCSSDKARKLLDYKTTKSLSESMDRMIDFIKNSGPKNLNIIIQLKFKVMYSKYLVKKTVSDQIY